jgi:hypothetical protein
MWVWEVALLRFLSYPVAGGITGLPGPKEIKIFLSIMLSICLSQVQKLPSLCFQIGHFLPSVRIRPNEPDSNYVITLN